MPESDLTVVAKYPTELEAQLAASKLEAQGIRSAVLGGFTAGFIADAPGLVQLVVSKTDFDAAQECLRSE